MSVTLGVVIPTWNRSAWVVECVNSVLAQTREPDSIVVVDDGSTDDTAEALREFGERVTLVRRSRSGPAAAKNTGVARSAASWVMFVDSDDRLEPHALATMGAILGAFLIWVI